MAEELSVLEKSFLVLDALRLGTGPMSLTALAESTGLPRSTVHRLVQQMTALGAVAPGPHGVTLGRTLFELGSQVPDSRGMREVALPFMQDLYEVTHMTIHLGVRDDVDILLVEKIRGHHSLSYAARVGRRLPLTCTGIGKALLAHQPAPVIEEILARPLRRLTPSSITDAAPLRRQLDEARRTGTASDHGEAQEGLSCVAAPVMQDGLCVAALAVSGPSEELDVVRIAPAVRTAALAVGRRLSPT